MRTSYARTAVLTLAIGLAGFAAGCGSHAAGSPEAAPPAAGTAAPPVLTGSSSPPPVAGTAGTPSAAGARTAGTAAPRANRGAAKAAAAQAGPVARCTGRDVTAELRIGKLAGGRQSAALTVRNTAAAPCELTGFPELQLLGHGYDPISTMVVHEGSSVPLRLASGATAWSSLSWATTPAADEHTGGCQPAASRLAVFVPSDQTEVDVDYSAGPICAHGRVEANAFRAGIPTA